MLRWVTVAGLLCSVGVASAEPVRMSSADIKHVMQPGALLEIDTPLRISIPVKVESNGIVSGEAGALGLTLGAMKDRGRWWTESDQLCVKWFRWFDAKARCISLQRDGSKVYWQENSGESGTATITESPTAIVAKASPAVEKPKKVQTASADRVEKMRVGAGDVADVSFEERAPAAQPVAPVRTRVEPTREAVAIAPPPPKLKEAPRTVRVAKVPSTRKKPATNIVKPSKSTPDDLAEASAVSTSSISPGTFRVSRVVDGDMLNVRSGPSEYHQAVGAIPARGRGVMIVGACRDLWCPIRHGRLKGWVNRYYLAEDISQASPSRH